MRIYLIIISVFILFSQCRNTELAHEKKISINELYEFCSCYEKVFESFETEIDKNKYTYIFGYPFCNESNYVFSKNDFDLLGIKFNDSTRNELNNFFEFTWIERRYIYKISRESYNLIIFGGFPIGASGQFTDVIAWLMIDMETGNILTKQSSLSKSPFVFYIDSNNRIKLIDFDYKRGNNGFLKVRQGITPITLQLDPYIFNGIDFTKEGNDKADFFCIDSNFYSNNINWP